MRTQVAGRLLRGIAQMREGFRMAHRPLEDPKTVIPADDKVQCILAAQVFAGSSGTRFTTNDTTYNSRYYLTELQREYKFDIVYDLELKADRMDDVGTAKAVED